MNKELKTIICAMLDTFPEKSQSELPNLVNIFICVRHVFLNPRIASCMRGTRSTVSHVEPLSSVSRHYLNQSIVV